MDKDAQVCKVQDAPVDPGVEAWALSFDAWLDTEEGRAWLLSRGELEAERKGTDWEGKNW
jgi:hypothetical protein